ncbi:hypothetical protein ABEF95_006393 [Exophiala dermatitidis]
MSFRNVMKDGWHPKGKEGGKESWRGDFKGINQVAGWMGKGRDPHKEEAVDHVSRPLSTLKDPALFGPPPKNVNYHGGAALPNEITPHRTGLGAPLKPEEIEAARRVTTPDNTQQEQQEAETRKPGPPLPYRADRTGLKTDHLPPPPVHRDVVTRSTSMTEGQQSFKPKPNLPPRLPSRQNTGTSGGGTPPPATTLPSPQQPPPAYEAIPARQPNPTSGSNYGINQAAVNRLGTAGVSVPALGIGNNSSSNPWHSESSQSNTIPQSPSPNPPRPALNQLSELQSRFARMNTDTTDQQHHPITPETQQPVAAPQAATSSVSSTSPPAQPTQGTTWAEKQAALRTAQNFQRDPSSVSTADARATASTVSSFRERHQDSITSAGQKASQWNKKYNVTGRLNSFLEKHSSPTSETPPSTSMHTNPDANAMPSPPLQQAQSPPPQTSNVVASISRKPPPPPPPKKPATMHVGGGVPNGVAGQGSAAPVPSPPPVPLGTKPSYS